MQSLDLSKGYKFCFQLYLYSNFLEENKESNKKECRFLDVTNDRL